jgi:biotin synthase
MDLVAQIRVSLGTAIGFRLIEGKLDAPSATAYLMTYREGRCLSNCSFCAQAQESKSKTQLLSRITWPVFPTVDVIEALSVCAEQKKIKRVCIQALTYPEVFSHLQTLTKEIKSHTSLEVSLCCQPQNRETIEQLKASGADRLGIAIDGATPEIFSRVKGWGYRWESQFLLFEEARSVFGREKISTHLIAGLGETEREASETIQLCVDRGVLPALFAFTPVRGTALEKCAAPKISSYRRVQLARYLIVQREIKATNFTYNAEGKIRGFGLENARLESIISSGLPFQTSGCLGCNRPYYNESPRGPIYNYPKAPNTEEIAKIKEEILAD